MAATKYTYSVSGDFPNQKVDVNRLTKEIRESAIVTALDYIDVSGDDCDIWFKDALSGGDQTILDGIVAAHSGEPLPDAAKPVTIEGSRFDSDGKQVIVPTPAPAGSFTWYTSAGDQLAPLKRGEGTPTRITFAAAETGMKTVELDFAEGVYIHDGEISWRGVDDFDGTDTFSVYVKFDQTNITPNGGGTGNCTLYNGYLILPMAGDGDYDVDLAAACPIPSSSDGQWVVNEKTEEITVYVDGQTLGKYDQRCVLLYGITPQNLYLIRNVSMGSPRGIFEIDAYLVEWMSKHWKLGMEVNKVKSPVAAVEMNGIIMLFRWKATTDDS
jgi:hypothetical protein